MAYRTVTVLENEQVAPEVFAMTVPAGDGAKPGQFYMLRRPDSAVLLPRAISVCDVTGEGLLFLYQRVGRGTGELSRLKAGDALCITGPLGNGFDLDALSGKVALVCGGIGAAPMLYTAKVLKKRGMSVDCYAGFKDISFLTDELSSCVDKLEISTESGKEGHKGFVTGIFPAFEYDYVLCCGPEPMMQAVTRMCIEAKTPIYISMENKMACGLGACLVCTCTDKNGKNRRTCQDGPVFRGEEINFDA